MRSDEKPILERIEKVLAELSKSVTPASPIPDPAPREFIVPTADARPAGMTTSSSERLNVAIAWMRARQKRDLAFGDDLFFDPAWSILLELYVHHRQRTAVSITSLCIAAKIPPSTGLRWIALLEKRGLATREADPFDKRKSYATLTSDAIERIERALDETMESNRQLGIERVGRIN